MVNPRGIKDQEGGWLPHKVLKDQGKVATSQDTQRSGEGGYIPHKILTDQGKLATSRVIRLEGLTSREEIESMRINCKPHHGIHVGCH